ncbi:hypothetical protein IFM89_024975 [Coptis chinensis]|uniref:Chalcone/stilbene synthase C-terminal domain-containing protein n=1 Tax=Coptis chinensis TaxID=261450 RepID=A0A835LVB2_9MAGN|nr:hypothetical protein IFM89_024975 [Coptis chinensis]
MQYYSRNEIPICQLKLTTSSSGRGKSRTGDPYGPSKIASTLGKQVASEEPCCYLAENNWGAGQAIQGDGAAAVIVGADPISGIEHPLFELVSASQTILPVHPGGRAVVEQVEDKLNLKPGKLTASRQVMYDYGNMSSATVLYVIDEMRKKSAEERHKTTGEGLEWGALIGFELWIWHYS